MRIQTTQRRGHWSSIPQENVSQLVDPSKIQGMRTAQELIHLENLGGVCFGAIAPAHGRFLAREGMVGAFPLIIVNLTRICSEVEVESSASRWPRAQK